MIQEGQSLGLLVGANALPELSTETPEGTKFCIQCGNSSSADAKSAVSQIHQKLDSARNVEI
jgi:hypothetical protein